jgi:hypothetical protein
VSSNGNAGKSSREYGVSKNFGPSIGAGYGIGIVGAAGFTTIGVHGITELVLT